MTTSICEMQSDPRIMVAVEFEAELYSKFYVKNLHWNKKKSSLGYNHMFKGGGQILISGIKKGLKRPFKQIRPPREALLGLLAGSLSVSLSVGREDRGPLCGAAGGP